MKFVNILIFSFLGIVFPAFSVDPAKAAIKTNATNYIILLEATKKNAIDRVQKALFAGINPNICNANGVTSLMIASYKGHYAMAKLLLAHKANADLVTFSNAGFNLGKWLSHKNKGATALMLASYAGNPDIVEALIMTGVQVNTQDSDGQTALIYAILGDSGWPHKPLSEQRKKIIELLLSAGANPHLCDHNDLDAVYYYSCVAGLIPGFSDRYEKDPNAAAKDTLL